MKIQTVELFRYTLPLQSPLLMKGSTLTHRQGILLKLKVENALGYGDIAPFPNLHSETLQEAFIQVKEAAPFLASTIFPENLNLLDAWPLPLKKQNWFPSVCFGIETALLQLKASLEKKTVASYLNPNAHLSIPVNGLLTGSLEKILFHANRLKEEGYQAVKLKIGGKSFEEDLEKVYQVREVIGSEIALRLDVNRGWTLKGAIQFGKEATSASIEYIEEPLQNPQDLNVFFQETGIFVALDETLAEEKCLKDFLQKTSGVKAFVLKPSVFSSLSKTISLIQLAQCNQILPVFSDVFLSGVGLAMEINLAASLIHTTVPAGFDTYQRFQEDVLKQRIPLKEGSFYLSDVNTLCTQVASEKLEIHCG